MSDYTDFEAWWKKQTEKIGWLQFPQAQKMAAKSAWDARMCLCEVYNVGDIMGDIAVDEKCPFHGHLLNELYKE